MGKIRTFIGGFSAWWGGGKGRRKKSGKSTHAKQRDLRLEPLEERRLLMAAPVTVTSSLSHTVYGQPATFSAGLPSGLGGAVSFFDGSTPLGSSSLTTNSNALAFDGSTNYIDLGQTLNFTQTTAFSVSFWMKSTNYGLQMIVGKGDGFVDHTSPGWTVFTAYDHLYFQLNAATEYGISELQAWDWNAGGDVCNGSWHFVVVTYDGSGSASGVKFVINGAAQTLGTDSNNLSAGNLTSDADATIGATPSPNGMFSGDLAELDVFNGVISSTSQGLLYNGGAGDYGAAGVSGLLAGYHLNAAPSNTIADYSGNGINGTLHGSTSFVTGPIAAAEASITTSQLAAGTHTITAYYGGGGGYDPGTSPDLTETVAQAPPVVTLTATPTPSAAGQSVTVTASVPPGADGDITFMNGTTTLDTVTASSGDALSFSQYSSTNCVDVPATPSLNSLTDGTNTQLTVSVWVYPTGDMNNNGIIYKGPYDGSTGAISVSFAQGSSNYNKLDFRLNDSTTSGDGQLTSGTYIPEDQWTFITCTYDGSEQKIYINGVLDASGSYSEPLADDTSDLRIGACYSPSYEYGYGDHYLTFQGAIDEVGIWKEALGASTIAGIYNGGMGTYGTTSAAPWNSGAFIAGYHFDEGSGATVYDYSTYGNTGTVESGATWVAGMDVANLATFTTSELPTGANTLTAIYGGNDNYTASTSAPLTQIVVGATLPDGVTSDPVDQATPSPLTDGSLVLPVSAAGLTYVSGSNGQPIVSADATIDSSNGTPLTGVTATLSVSGVEATSTVYYSADDLTGSLGNGTYRFAVPMPTSLATGRYSYTLTITQNYEVGQTITPYSGMKDVLNWNSSPFGQGWNLDGLDQLVVYESGDVSLVKSDGTMTYFTSAGGGTFTSEDGPFKFMTLALVDVDDVETYELTGTDGTMETFNSTSGQLTSVVDKDGNVTSYNYTSGLLSSIVDPSHHTTTFTYTDGLLTTITDFAGRETTLAYTSGQLTSITEPDPGDGETTPVMTFGYDPTSGLMTSYVDTDGNSTEFVYRADGTLDTATSADGPAMTYQSAQSLLVSTTGDGAPGSEANPSLLTSAATARAVSYDQSQNPTIYTFDAFGDPTSVEDALGNTTVYQRNCNGLVTEMDQPLGLVTQYNSYDSDGNLTEETLPNGSVQKWSYYYDTDTISGGGKIDLVESWTEYNGDTAIEQTVYTYYSSDGDSNGDLLSVEQEANGPYTDGAENLDNTGQNTTPGGDPITSYVYTGDPGGADTPPAGLVLSETNPDGDVTAFCYDPAGSPTATYQGQTVAVSSDTASFNYVPQSPGLTRTFEVYVDSTDETSGDYSFADTAGSLSLSPVGSTTTPLGDGWYDLGSVTLAAGDLSSTVTVNYLGLGTVSQVTLLEQTSATVYDGMENPLSVSDGLGNVTAATNDNLDRPQTTSQGQSVAFTDGSAAFNNVPQSPGQKRTFEVYVNSTSAPSSGYTSISDSDSGSPSFSFNGASSDLLGPAGSWYDLGTVTLAAGDLSSTVTIAYSDSDTGVSQVALLEQTSATVYDPAGNVLSQTDGLGRVTTTGYNNLQQPVSTAQGQVVPLTSGTAAFNNLPQTPGVPRTFTVYVQASSAPSDGSDYSISESGSASPALVTSISATTPLGEGWYELGTITLGESDTSSTLTVHYSGSGVTNVCLVQPMSAETYTPTGLVASQTNGNGGVTNFAYDALGEQTSESAPAPDPTAPTVRPVTTDVYDALGRVTAETDPLGHTTAFAYVSGTMHNPQTDTDFPGDSVATWQGQTLPEDSTSTDSTQTWTFSNLALGNDISGGASVSRVYNVYAQGSSSSDYSVSDGSLETGVSPALAASALGNGWVWLGTVTLDGSDTTTTLVVSHSTTATASNVCLLQLTTTETYNADGNLVVDTDALSNTTTYAYSPLGLPAQQSVDDGPELGPLYDKAGNVISTTDLQYGYVTEYKYDWLGDQVETDQPNASSGATGEGPITTESYDADGELVSQSLPNPSSGAAGGPTTSYSYDAFGNQVSSSLPNPTTGAAGGPTTIDTYDLDGELVGQTDPLENLTLYSFDAFGKEVSQSLPDPANGLQDSGSPTTTFTYDTMGDMLTLTDPVGNVTYWGYDGLSRKTSQSEIVATGYNTDGSVDQTVADYSYQYDLGGNLTQSTDADGQVIKFAYNSMDLETSETWYPTVADAVAGTGSDGSVSYTLDLEGHTLSASNTAYGSNVSTNTFSYNAVGDATDATTFLASVTSGGSPIPIDLASSYDYNGSRTSLTATIGDTPDFLNNYYYDALGDMTGITQTGDGGNTVSPKGVALGYDADSRLSGENLYASTDISSSDTGNLVATSTDTYDDASRLKDLTYTAQSTGATLASYTYEYDLDSRVSDFTYSSSTSAWNEQDSYTYDHNSQLTGTTYAIGQTGGEVGTSTYDATTSDSQTYDSNGNRTTTSDLTPGAESPQSSSNRMLFDGTYYYQYDANGNRIARWIDNSGHPEGSPQPGDTDVTIYGWNEKNELATVNYYANYGASSDGDYEIDYAYNAFGQMVTRSPSGSGVTGETTQHFIYDGQNIALVLSGSGAVVQRELYGAAVDRVFASENGATGAVNWMLTDAQGTVRDVAQFDGTTTTVGNHLFYNSFGSMTSQTSSSAADQTPFNYDGEWQDPTTGLLKSGLRWYDAVDGVFASQDPLGFGGGQTNLEEFCGNSPTNYTDPSGLAYIVGPDGQPTGPTQTPPNAQSGLPTIYSPYPCGLTGAQWASIASKFGHNYVPSGEAWASVMGGKAGPLTLGQLAQARQFDIARAAQSIQAQPIGNINGTPSGGGTPTNGIYPWDPNLDGDSGGAYKESYDAWAIDRIGPPPNPHSFVPILGENDRQPPGIGGIKGSILGGQGGGYGPNQNNQQNSSEFFDPIP